jgi:hypothetical protein
MVRFRGMFISVHTQPRHQRGDEQMVRGRRRRTTEDRHEGPLPVARHLSFVIRRAWTLNSPSVQAASGNQPLPCASAWNDSIEYL